MDKWNGCVALVTGSSCGIGAHLTKTLAESGMIVIGLGRRVDLIQVCAVMTNLDFILPFGLVWSSYLIYNTKYLLDLFFDKCSFPCKELANNVNATSKGKIIARKCDVTDESEVLSTFSWIKETFGHLDVFINNAGVIKSGLMLGEYAERYCPLLSMPCLFNVIFFFTKN